MLYIGSKVEWCGRELSHYTTGKGLGTEMPLTSSVDSAKEPAARPSPDFYPRWLFPPNFGLPEYPTGIVHGPCVCGSWPGGECFQCPVRRGLSHT